jgi:tartrate-resistant acid phosphatase type 5
MKKNSRYILIATLAVLTALILNNLGSFIMNVPRKRSGPLHRLIPTADKLRIFALGDTGTGKQDQKDVAAAMEARCLEKGVDGLLFLGDNIYQTGVSDIEDKDWEKKLWGIYSSPCLSKVPIYPVLGNHDYRDSPAAQIEYSLVNPRWRMPNRFYSVDFGSLLKVVAFDSQISEFCFNAKFCAVDFLLEELEKETTTWKIVTAHHPLTSASVKGYSHTGGFRGIFLKPLLCDDTDLYIAGHSHHMEYRALEDCRMDLVVSGGGGAKLYEVQTNSGATFAKSAHGFFEIEASRKTLEMKFIGKNGEVLFSQSKEPANRSDDD